MFLLIVESLLVGAVTGFLSGLLGIGGGFILVPLLATLGIPIHNAIGASLVFVACASLAGVSQHFRQGTVDILVAAIVAVPAAFMAIEGAHFSGLLPASTLSLSFSVLLIGVFLMYMFAPASRDLRPPAAVPPEKSRWHILHRQRTVADVSYSYNVNTIKAVFSGVMTGALAGFGVGGGFFLVPVSVVILRIPLRVAIGTSLAVLFFPASLGSLTHWRLGHIDPLLCVPMIITGILGSRIGARYVAIFSPKLIKQIFLGLLALGAISMFVKGIKAL